MRSQHWLSSANTGWWWWEKTPQSRPFISENQVQFQVTPLTRLSWSHRQCQLFLGVFQILKVLPTVIPLCSAWDHTAVPQGGAPGLSSQRGHLLPVSPLAVKMAMRARTRDNPAPGGLLQVKVTAPKWKKAIVSLAGHNSKLGNISYVKQVQRRPFF